MITQTDHHMSVCFLLLIVQQFDHGLLQHPLHRMSGILSTDGLDLLSSWLTDYLAAGSMSEV